MKIMMTDGRYKSIQAPFIWDDVSEFSVITGLNGAGKSQLLELISIFHNNKSELTRQKIKIEISGTNYQPWEVASHQPFISISDPQPVNIAEIGASTAADVRSIRTMLQGITPGSDPASFERLRRLKIRLEEKYNLSSLSEEQLDLAISREYVFSPSDWQIHDLPQRLSKYFVEHYLNIANDTLHPDVTGLTTPSVKPYPWDAVNKMLKSFGFPYNINNPYDRKNIKLPFHLKLLYHHTNEEVPFTSLSSGEKVILFLVLWLYTSGEHGLLPKLILLDEPDAHLHPFMIKQFMGALENVIVKEHGSRVIMTTHRPDTIALAPENSLFELCRGQKTTIRRVSQTEAMNLLCSGLVTVMPHTRCVLVEDQKDALFYNSARDALQREGLFQGDTFLMFQPVSLKDTTGGKNSVEQWVAKLSEANLGPAVQGIIDRDVQNQPSRFVHVIKRYCRENYLFDPLLILMHLLTVESRKFNISFNEQFKIYAGDYEKLRSLEQTKLQALADKIFLSIHEKIPELPLSTLNYVNFSTGITLQYPEWVFNKTRQELNGLFTKIEATLNGARLLTQFQQLRLVPIEFLEIFRTIVD